MRRVSGLVLSYSLALLLATALRCTAAQAQTLVHFDLPAQSLAQSLKAIGTATNTDVGFSSSEVAGLTAPALKADLTLDGALARVLLGTGLRPQHLDDHTVMVGTPGASSSDSGQMRPAQGKTSALAGEPSDGSAPLMLAQANVPGPEDTTNSESKGNRDSAGQLQEIVVTGSHIRGIENKTNPIIVIDQAQIEQSGYSSTQDLFRSLPQNFSSGETTQDGFLSGGGFNSGFASGINLRGLGASSTLVLLDGHRLAPSVLGTVVDVSAIPLSAVDHIDILTDGSSAIYGSDAVGGVVNIVLKKDFTGADSSIRYGSVTDGSRNEIQAAQTFGSAWSSGNVAGTIQYQSHSALDSRDRDFASGLASPSDLLPKDHTYAGTLYARQQLGDSVELYSDVLWSKRYFGEVLSDAPISGIDIEPNDGVSSTVTVAAGARYDFAPKWSIELNGLYASQNTLTNRVDEGADFPSPLIQLYNTEFDERSVDLLLNGKVAKTGAGDIGLAIGGSYRVEDPSYRIYEGGAFVEGLHPDRNVKAYYGELYIPLVGDKNSVRLVQALELSAAVRTDRYSDFGSTTNPRLGLRWSPAAGLSFRGSYGRSFRAPTEAEAFSALNPAVYITSFANPNGTGTVPVLESSLGKPLTAERSRSIDLGLEYQPANLRGVDFTANYYDIRYTDRIVQVYPPSDALREPNVYGQLITNLPNAAAAQSYLNAATAAGAKYYGDYTGDGVDAVRYAFDAGVQNASLVQQSGIDLIGSFVHAFSTGSLSAQVNATFVDKIETAYTPGASSADLVGTYGNPPKWRLRESTGWATKGWELNGTISIVGTYVNTAGIGNPPVSSWTTIDLVARLHLDEYLAAGLWKGVTLGVSVLNVLNRNPPYINAGSVTQPINYDPLNANPLGRFVAFDLKKKWR